MERAERSGTEDGRGRREFIVLLLTTDDNRAHLCIEEARNIYKDLKKVSKMEPLLKKLGLVVRLARVTQLTDNGRNLILVRFEDTRSLKRYLGLVGKGATTFHLSSAWVVVHLLPIGRQRGYVKEIKATTVGEELAGFRGVLVSDIALSEVQWVQTDGLTYLPDAIWERFYI